MAARDRNIVNLEDIWSQLRPEADNIAAFCVDNRPGPGYPEGAVVYHDDDFITCTFATWSRPDPNAPVRLRERTIGNFRSAMVNMAEYCMSQSRAEAH